MEDLWKHRGHTMRCRTCMWFVKKDYGIGRCRRRAPTLGGWPVVYPDDWCGDHKIDAEKLTLVNEPETGQAKMAPETAREMRERLS